MNYLRPKPSRVSFRRNLVFDLTAPCVKHIVVTCCFEVDKYEYINSHTKC